MTRYGKTMMEALSEIREGYSPKQIKMAIGIASDKRYAGGNMSGAVAAIEKIKKGLSDHKQVAAVLKRQNEELEEGKSSTGYELYHKDFSSAMQHAYAFAKKKFGITIDPKEIDDKVASGPKKPSNGKTNSYRLKGNKGNIQVQVANLDNKRYELNMYKEEVELDENKNLIKDYEKYMSQGNKKDANAIDYLMSMPKYKRMSKDQMAKIIGGHKRKGIFREEVELQELTSAEKKLIDLMYDKKGNLTPLGKKVMDHGKKEEVELDENKKADLAKKLAKASQASKKGKSKVTLKKAPWDKKEEADKPKVDNRPDSAKDVDAARDDKKKTRIAQLQLQIAKATETINKLNTQEK